MYKIIYFLKNTTLLLAMLAIGISNSFAADLYNNGTFANSPGSGVGGADESIVQSVSLGMSTLGFGHQFVNDNTIADDFTIPAGDTWTIDDLVFYAYQTGSSTTSTITGVRFQIWDGIPEAAGSNVVFGDLTTNRLASTAWSNTYRVSETTMGTATNRPIMRNIATAGLTLTAGTYWIEWQTDGSLPSGPWAPPLTITGTAVTGDGLQQLNNTRIFNPASDFGPGAPVQGFPFIVRGSLVRATIPTMSQWGIMIFGLLILNLGIMFIYRQEKAL